VDIWSAGCILAEMILRKPLFPGEDINHQIKLIFELLGKQNLKENIGNSSGSINNIVSSKPLKEFEDIFENVDELAIDLLKKNA